MQRIASLDIRENTLKSIISTEFLFTPKIMLWCLRGFLLMTNIATLKRNLILLKYKKYIVCGKKHIYVSQ